MAMDTKLETVDVERAEQKEDLYRKPMPFLPEADERNALAQ
jgi:hypothetical protein